MAIAKLVAIDGPDKGLELILEKGELWIIGRDPKECDFVLDDPKVSRKHAQIRKEGDQYYIKNLSRTNPILFKEEPLKGEEALTFNQTLKIGQSNFRFSEIKAAKERHASDYDQLFEDLDEPPIALPPISEKPTSKKREVHDEDHYDTIFQDVGDEDTYGDLSESYVADERFILKVLSGPNSGAEFAMQKGRSYIIGTDVTGCDIIFNDLSVSRHHARISITNDDEIVIEDLGSRNGVIVDEERLLTQKIITPKNMIALGTTTFIVVDREASEETIVTKLTHFEEEEPIVEETVEEKVEVIPVKKGLLRGVISESTFVLTGILIAAILILGTGALMLFKTSPVEKFHKDYTKNIQTILGNDFPDIKFTYNTGNGELFVVGHVVNSTQREELMYKLNNLSFITQIKDDIVVDEYVDQEMNLILSRNPNWLGISIHSPNPGQFVISGYLPTRDSYAILSDYMNVQFPYVDRLTNYVVVEEDLYQDIVSKLHNYGFYNVQVEITNGEVVLAGYVNQIYEKAFQKVENEISKIMGVRKINNYVVLVGKKSTPKDVSGDPSIVNLTNYLGLTNPPNMTYTITGYAEQQDQIRAVEINGQILTKGDYIDGMKVIGFDCDYVYLEKNDLKYKIECIK